MQKARVYVDGIFAGILQKHSDKYFFQYDSSYLKRENVNSVSLSLPLSDKIYESPALFPFFDGLLQEGWLKSLTLTTLHIAETDKFSLLVKNGLDCVGNVTLKEVK